MTIYQVKWFRGIVQSDNQKFDVLKIEERKVKINYDILGEQSKTNNNGVLVVSGDDNNWLIEKDMVRTPTSKKQNGCRNIQFSIQYGKVSVEKKKLTWKT